MWVFIGVLLVASATLATGFSAAYYYRRGYEAGYFDSELLHAFKDRGLK